LPFQTQRCLAALAGQGRRDAAIGGDPLARRDHPRDPCAGLTTADLPARCRDRAAIAACDHPQAQRPAIGQRIAAYGRVTSPLSGKGREAALGLEWQPTRAPVRLIAERRFGLDGNPGGTGLGAIAGIDREWRGFRLEAYGQAGAVLRRRAEPYADGAARGTRTVSAAGPVRLALGAGTWGAAQRDAQRLDIGPSATLAVHNLRLALDWRQRVAGEARPGSGLALTLGADF